LKSPPLELTLSLQSLVTVYKAWVDRKQTHSEDTASLSFLDLMRTYSSERVVFLSPRPQSSDGRLIDR